MLTIEGLKKFGADTDEGLGRCMNNESFYFRLIGMALADGSFDALGVALDEGDLERAFDEAHKLKGALGNLSLTPIYEPVSALTELLRNKTPGDYRALYDTVVTKKKELEEIANG